MVGNESTRRTLLKQLGTAGVAASLGSSVPLGSAASGDGTRTVLGDFEEDLDGWTTNGGNTLHRIQRSERPFAISTGSYGLKVGVDGDPHPMIANKDRVKQADLVENPYLLTTVTPSAVGDTLSDLSFKFRLHYSATGTTRPKHGKKNGKHGRSARGKRKPGKKPVLVEESESMDVQPHVQRTLTWDLSTVATAKRANAKRLEISWYPTAHPPDRGPRGKGDGYEYTGSVIFDAIHVTDNLSSLSAQEIAAQMDGYKQAHGQYEETIITSSTADTEAGKFVFGDGTQIAFTFIDVAEDKSKFQLDGDTYRIGRGW